MAASVGKCRRGELAILLRKLGIRCLVIGLSIDCISYKAALKPSKI